MRTSLFLLSCASLVFEINLSRLFSVTQFYHFAFMIVSLALLGFGASGTFLAIFPHTGRNHPNRTLSVLAIGTSLSIVGSYLLTNWLSFDSFSIAWDRRQIGILALHYTALALPFFFSGMATGMLLGIYAGSAGSVYALNLVGSALGCLGALAAPTFLGGEGTVILSSCLAAFAGLVSLFTRQENPRKFKIWNIAVGLIFAINLIVFGWQAITKKPVPLFEIKYSPYKSLSYALQVPGAEIISQQWNAFSRVDVVASPGIRSLPGVSLRYLETPPPERGVLVDGDNLSPVVLPGADLTFTDYLPGSAAYKLRPGARALILEPGGGLDLLTAANQGASQVKAVESNALITEAASHIYALQNIETIHSTGRSFLRRSQEEFDVIVFSLANTYHPVRSGAYSLAEDYRYTLEAFQDGLARLDEDGILVITRWLQIPPSEWLRSFVLAVTALEQGGLEPTNRIAAIRSFNIGLLLIKKAPFSEEELEIIRTFSDDRAFDLVYLPDIQPEETNRFNILETDLYYQNFGEFLLTPSRQKWLEKYPYDITPPTDDHPFFGHFFKWSQTPQIFAELGKSWQPFGGAGYFVLLVLLALAVGMAGVIILLPLAVIRKTSPSPRVTMACLLYFGLIGLAFLMVEIPLVQRFILYLGHPSYALTSALFSILLFSGFGSLNYKRFNHRISMGALILTAIITLWMLPKLFDLTLGYPLFSRILIAVVSLGPLGFLMGIPLPRGIEALETSAPGLIPWAWGVNGALSVIASILAALISLSFGFTYSLFAGALCYTGAWFAAPHLHKQG